MDDVDIGHGELIASTEKAILVRLERFGDEWIPLSQIGDDSELWDGCAVGSTGNVWVTEWLAKQHGWI